MIKLKLAPATNIDTNFSYTDAFLRLWNDIGIRIRKIPNKNERTSLRVNVHSSVRFAIGHNALTMLLPVSSKKIGSAKEKTNPAEKNAKTRRLDKSPN